MGLSFSLKTTFWHGSYQHLQNVTDLEISVLNGEVILFSASGADGGLTSFKLVNGKKAALVDYTGYGVNSGTAGVTDIEIAVVDGEEVLIPSGQYDDNLAFHALSTSGDFAGASSAWEQGTLGGFTNVSVVASWDGTSVMVGSIRNTGGLCTFSFNGDAQAVMAFEFPDTESVYMRDAAAFVGLETQDQTFLFVASAFEHGVTSYRVKPNGWLVELDSIGAADGVGLGTPSAIEALNLFNQRYVVVAGSGSSSLSNFWVSKSGVMWENDTVWDSGDTRFQNVTAIESFVVKHRGFIAAGGSDGGITLFEILPDGLLREVTTYVDGFDTALDNITAIEAHVFNGEVQLFVASGNEHGITQLKIDTTNFGSVYRGFNAADVIHGSGLDNLLSGGRNADSLYGGYGDDVLLDGKGSDSMTGGPGADVFVFVDDWMSDTIEDFEPGIDRIDISDWDMIYRVEDLTISQKSWGAEITFGKHTILLHTEDGSSMSAADFSADDFVF